MRGRAILGSAMDRATALGRCTSGMALVEFAMSLPVLLALGLVGLETANYAIVNLKISNIAMITADNAARVRDSIDEADVIELMTGAKMTGEGIDFGERGRIILSSVEPNSAGPDGESTGQWIRWQRCDGRKNEVSEYGPEDTGEDDDELQYVGDADNPISAADGTAVMVAEVVYDYQPIIPNSFLEGREIRYVSAFNVRQRVNQALNNAGDLSDAQRRTCNHFEA